ncbi:hypothetical protein SOVF_132940 [Spinacia oleracea]|nr:hypothetical protein SOVF_132940 [Spinacia oleracea]
MTSDSLNEEDYASFEEPVIATKFSYQWGISVTRE